MQEVLHLLSIQAVVPAEMSVCVLRALDGDDADVKGTKLPLLVHHMAVLLRYEHLHKSLNIPSHPCINKLLEKLRLCILQAIDLGHALFY